jgi:hypothetical protein
VTTIGANASVFVSSANVWVEKTEKRAKLIGESLMHDFIKVLF